VRNALILLAVVALVILAVGALNNGTAFEIDYVAGTMTEVSLFWVSLVIAAVVFVAGLAATWFALAGAAGGRRKLEAELQSTYERLREAEREAAEARRASVAAAAAAAAREAPVAPEPTVVAQPEEPTVVVTEEPTVVAQPEEPTVVVTEESEDVGEEDAAPAGEQTAVTMVAPAEDAVAASEDDGAAEGEGTPEQDDGPRDETSPGS
jgi:hypothetical protein